MHKFCEARTNSTDSKQAVMLTFALTAVPWKEGVEAPHDHHLKRDNYSEYIVFGKRMEDLGFSC
jgi:hypothetical protein